MEAIPRIEYNEHDTARVHSEAPPDPTDMRSAFEHDRSRIIHSAAFRRLQSKTQVYGLGASDYYRTRLTHSLEVAQIGKGLALKFGANPDLVEAICLAHDIGHPPFGHAGEKALHEHIDPKKNPLNEGFNGNAQNLRLLTYFERKSSAYEGLNLTKATLDGLVKYPWAIGDARQDGSLQTKGYYRTDRDAVASFKPKSIKTFECTIMNWADDVAYSSHDLEDALVIGTIRADELYQNRGRILRHAQKTYAEEYPSYELENPLVEKDVDRAVRDIYRSCIRPGYRSEVDRLALIKTFVGQHINECVLSVTFEDVSNPPAPRYGRKIIAPSPIAKKVEIYKAIVYMCVIMTATVLSLQEAGKRVIVDLYDYFNDWSAWRGKRQIETQVQLFPPDLRSRATRVATFFEAGNVLPAQQFARDYVTSMTDRFAEDLWKRLKIPGEGALFTARS